MLHSVRSKLEFLAQQKAKRARLQDDVNSGKYDGLISNASEFFREKENEPPPPSRSAHHNVNGATILTGARGETVFREFALSPHDSEFPFGAHSSPLSETPFSSAGLAAFCTGFDSDFGLGDIAFIDTETTGLMGATGTIAFLVGVGWWEPGAAGWVFRLEQFLITDFCHECDLLERLAARLERFAAICSYNGKSYDAPILRARSIMHRLPRAVYARRHADLLHFARRLWRGVLPSVSLKTVEREILQIDRGPDIDGAEIPQVFFSMARGEPCARLPAVMKHNAQDIVTLAALLSFLSQVAANPMAQNPHSLFPIPHSRLTSPEFAALARWQGSRKRWDDAAIAMNRALELHDGRDAAEEQALLFQLSLIHKRRRAWPEAVEIWEQLRTLPLHRARAAWMESAKYLEHVKRDAAGALELVRRWRKQHELESELRSYMSGEVSSSADELTADLQRREQRLLRKISRPAATRRP
ncbi:hypothetical protein BH09SUM1_BH09SUM1_07050 [soil metagenome]